jgi:phytoene synthase
MDELKAAGITDSELRNSYLECKRLNNLHGKTYFLATRLLPPAKRPFVHALYGFARYADEIVDDLASTLSEDEKAKSLKSWGDEVLANIKSGKSHDHIGAALVDTVNRFSIPISYFEAFLHSMTMDLTVTEYHTYEDLYEYVYGSAAVIGLEMVPILGTVSKQSMTEANMAAEKLGTAFQLANFIRDVGEDLTRGRVYLPVTELQSHGVTREMLEERIVTPQIKNALREQIQRVRRLQAEAKIGINLLSAESRPCIEAASELYCGIVDEVEKIEYQIFDKRAKTSNWRRLKVALPAYIKARNSR